MERWVTRFLSTVLRACQWVVVLKSQLPSIPMAIDPANNGVYHQKHVISKIEADGRVVYEYQDKPVQVYSKLLRRLCGIATRSSSSRVTTTFKSNLTLNPTC